MTPTGRGTGCFSVGQGPQLVLKGGIQCPPMAELDNRVSELLDKYHLKTGDIVRHHFSPIAQLSKKNGWNADEPSP